MSTAKKRDTNRYPGLDFSRDELRDAMQAGYRDLVRLVSSEAFRQAYRDMYSLPPNERPRFVRDVFLNEVERRRRGIQVPDGVLVQTSSFGDRRPTLFVVKKFLPERFHSAWENVNITFDNEFADDEISRDPAIAWRQPLSVGLQNALLSSDVPLEDVPDLGVDDPVWSTGLGESTKSEVEGNSDSIKRDRQEALS